MTTVIFLVMRHLFSNRAPIQNKDRDALDPAYSKEEPDSGRHTVVLDRNVRQDCENDIGRQLHDQLPAETSDDCQKSYPHRYECVENGSDRDHDQFSTVRCLLYTSPSPRDRTRSRMPSSA